MFCLAHRGPGDGGSWQQFLDELLVVFGAAYSSLEKISPRFVRTIRCQVRQCVQRNLRALLEPLGSEVVGEAETALLKATEDMDIFEWIRCMLEQIGHPEFQRLVKALREQRGPAALETTDLILVPFFVWSCLGGSLGWPFA